MSYALGALVLCAALTLVLDDGLVGGVVWFGAVLVVFWPVWPGWRRARLRTVLLVAPVAALSAGLYVSAVGAEWRGDAWRAMAAAVALAPAALLLAAALVASRRGWGRPSRPADSQAGRQADVHANRHFPRV